MKRFLRLLKVEDTEDDSESYFWTFAATLSFCSLASSLPGSRVWNEASSTFALWTDAKLEFQSASPWEQRPATRLWPLMLPGKAITSCVPWHRKRGHYISHDAFCLFLSDTCCSQRRSQWLNWEWSPWKTQATIWPHDVNCFQSSVTINRHSRGQS